MLKTTVTGLISGSGELPLLAELPRKDVSLESPYGAIPGPVRAGQQGDNKVVGLCRHGEHVRLAPHVVNYRANLWLLKHLGAEQVVAIYTVGAIDGALQPGDLVLPDQIIDYTWGRRHTYDDAGELHVDFTVPFAVDLAEEFSVVAQRRGQRVTRGGVYGCTQGPRLETAAEIDRMERDGCTLVGMTAMPEAGLARELGLPLLGICVIVNPAAGRGPDPRRIDHRALARDRAVGLARAGALIAEFCGENSPS